MIFLKKTLMRCHALQVKYLRSKAQLDDLVDTICSDQMSDYAQVGIGVLLGSLLCDPPPLTLTSRHSVLLSRQISLWSDPNQVRRVGNSFILQVQLIPSQTISILAFKKNIQSF